MNKEFIKLFFMTLSDKLSYLENKKLNLIENKSIMVNNMNYCERFFKGELDDTFYEIPSNYSIHKHLYRNSTKKYNEIILELKRINNLINKLT